VLPSAGCVDFLASAGAPIDLGNKPRAGPLAALAIEIDADRIRRQHGRANRVGFENLSHLRLDSS
jgi:hypothetical protein